MNKVGQKLKVLVDRKEGEHYVARTEGDSPEIDNEVLIPVSGNKLKAGTFSVVKIVSAGSYDLFAEPAGPLAKGRE
jgi:ribosomal protein S12 methylthiotransferase